MDLRSNIYAPITYSWGFLEAPMETLINAFVSWKRGYYKDIVTLYFDTPIETAFHKLEPLTGLRRREILVETKSNWVAFWDNSICEGEPRTAASYFAGVLKCRILAIMNMPHTVTSKRKEGTFGAVQFELFSPEPTDWLNYVRAVSVTNDGYRWSFKAFGIPQPYEDLSRYTSKKIRERFTSEMLETYCKALGIDLFNSEFYGPKGALIDVKDPLPANFGGVSLKEAQAQIGIFLNG